MKKYMVVLTAIVMVVAMVGGAWAAGSLTPNVAVSGTVASVCVAGGAGATLNFGTLDAVTNAAGATANLGGYTLWCTKDDSVTFAVDNGTHFSGTRRLLGAGSGAFIPYTVAFTTPVLGLGRNNDMISALGMSATIAAGAIDLAPVDTYGDTLVLTITY